MQREAPSNPTAGPSPLDAAASFLQVLGPRGHTNPKLRGHVVFGDEPTHELDGLFQVVHCDIAAHHFDAQFTGVAQSVVRPATKTIQTPSPFRFWASATGRGGPVVGTPPTPATLWRGFSALGHF